MEDARRVREQLASGSSVNETTEAQGFSVTAVRKLTLDPEALAKLRAKSERDQTIRRLRGQGLLLAAIADQVGRSRNTVLNVLCVKDEPD